MDLLDDTIKPDLKIKGYTFIFKEVDLIITKSNWFRTKEIKKLPYESLDSIALKRPSSDNLFILKILINLLAALIFQVSPAISNSTHILFNYHVKEDEAAFRLDIRIRDSEFKELKSILAELKN